MRVIVNNGFRPSEPADAAGRLETDRTIDCTQDSSPLPATSNGAGRDGARYVIEGEIARGGLGRILRAHDERLDRPVAVKELLTANAVARDRFQREVAITARLQHPAIVPVHDAGAWHGGAPYYVMKLLSGGRTLKEAVLDAGALDARIAFLPNVIAVGDAIAYAHTQGIIHRDLKPSNVLVGPFGETLVIDWGLAKDLSEPGGEELGTAPYRSTSAELTSAGSVLGTPQYMAPEQARGEPADRRTDVYALGALLYFVLTGSAPFDGHSVDEVIERVKREPPRPLTARQKGIPTDLIAIVDKALAAESSQRYADGSALVEDLRRYQTGQLVGAHDYSTLQLMSRWLRRHRTSVAVSLLFTITLAVLGVIAVRRIVRERDRAEARSNDLLLDQAKALLATDPTAAVASLRKYPANGSRVDVAQAIAADAADRGIARHVLRGHRSNAFRIAFSRDGQWLASASFDKTVRLWQPHSGGSSRQLNMPSPPFTVGFAGDGRAMAAAGEDGNVLVWTLPSGSARTLHAGHATVSGVLFHTHGQRLLTWGLDGALRDWDLRDGSMSQLRTIAGAAASDDERRLAVAATDGEISVVDPETRAWRVLGRHPGADNLAWAANGTVLASVANGDIEVWPLASGGQRRSLVGAHATGWLVALSADGAWLAAVDSAKAVHVWNLADGVHRLIPFLGSSPFAIIFARNSATLSVGDTSGVIHLIDVESGETRRLRGHTALIHQMAFTPDGRQLASASADGTIRLWDFDRAAAQRLGAHRSTALQAVYSPDASRLATASSDGDVVEWDAVTGRMIAHRPHERLVRQLAFSQDGKSIASASWDKSARVWDPTSGAVQTFASSSANVQRVAFLPGDGAIVYAGTDGNVWRGDVRSGNRQLIGHHDGTVNALACAPTGRVVAAGGESATMRVWDLDSGREQQLVGHQGAINALAFADGHRIVSTGNDGTLRVWDLASGRGSILRRQSASVGTMAVTLDGSLVASSGVAGTIWLTRLADASSRVLRGHDALVSKLAFARDGRTLASAARDGTFALWHLDDGREAIMHGNGVNILGLGISPDGRVMATGDADGVVRQWTVAAIRFVPGGRDLRGWLDTATDFTIADAGANE